VELDVRITTDSRCRQQSDRRSIRTYGAGPLGGADAVRIWIVCDRSARRGRPRSLGAAGAAAGLEGRRGRASGLRVAASRARATGTLYAGPVRENPKATRGLAGTAFRSRTRGGAPGSGNQPRDSASSQILRSVG